VTPEQRVTAAIDCTPYAKATPDAIHHHPRERTTRMTTPTNPPAGDMTAPSEGRRTRLGEVIYGAMFEVQIDLRYGGAEKAEYIADAVRRALEEAEPGDHPDSEGDNVPSLAPALTLAELDAIEARAAAATEGPWRVDASGDVGEKDYIVDAARWRNFVNTVSFGEDRASAEFVAAARTDVPVLVAALREAWATNAGLNRRAQIAEAALNDLTREPVGGRKHRPVAAEVWQRCVESHGAACPAMAEERAYRARLIGALKACWKVDMRKAREAQAELDHIRSELGVQRYHAEHDPCDVCSHLEAVELGELIDRLTLDVLGRTAERDRARGTAAAQEAENARLREGIESMMRGPARWVRKVRLVEPEWREATNE